MIEMR